MNTDRDITELIEQLPPSPQAQSVEWRTNLAIILAVQLSGVEMRALVNVWEILRLEVIQLGLGPCDICLKNSNARQYEVAGA